MIWEDEYNIELINDTKTKINVMILNDVMC